MSTFNITTVGITVTIVHKNSVYILTELVTKDWRILTEDRIFTHYASFKEAMDMVQKMIEVQLAKEKGAN